MRALLPAAALLLTLAGCSSDSADVPAPPAAPAPSTTTTAPAEPVDAGALIKRLKAKEVGLSNVAVQDEDTDPNNLLGRPNGYTSRASADLPGGDKNADKYSVDRGVVVEVFTDADAVASRSDYIQGLLKGNPVLGSEWHYKTAAGRALVRVTGNVKPSAAKKLETAVGSL